MRVYVVNFPSHGSGADVVDALPAGCCYKSTELSMHGGSAGGSSSLLLDGQQRQHVCGSPSSAAGAAPGSMLPSFGFTQEQVRACQSMGRGLSSPANKQAPSLTL